MPPEGRLPGSPADWLRHAHSDLELARVGRATKVLLEGLCFHAQQAAEKALKAVLVAKVSLFLKPTTSGHSLICCRKASSSHRR